ncbi:5,10-methylenetetrahydrofolate reductase, partial [Candidatus Woesearchaeota archaeon]|nr:5,10-methylenetetrahydrofolate reductase [Candidatus Woesearchaeota archaeon]
MIVTEKKPIDELIRHISDFNKIIILGCGDCATICKTGGINETGELKNILKKKNFDIVHTDVIDTACDRRQARLKLKKLPYYDAIIVLACGSGVQTIGDLIDKPVISGLDSKYIGEIKRIGNFTEKCSACG